jgi:thiol-disulfide isomerase/thioredoxin
LLALFACSNVLLARQNILMSRELSARTSAPRDLKPGDCLEPFIARGLYEETMSFGYREPGSRRLLLFLSTECAPCDEMAPHLQSLIEQAGGRYGVTLLFREWEDRKSVYEYLRAHGYMSARGRPSVALIDDPTRDAYKLRSPPTALLVGEGVNVEEVWVGGWGRETLSSVDAALGLAPR